MKPSGGKCIVHTDQVVTLEGNVPALDTMVILQFDSQEQAQKWYDSPAYQAIIGYRKQAAESRGYLVEGVS
ncbi:DUF1330 domain-containing protein [Utexia brackfieldae]|uniref:DUF1330 domain-containing protein n=1 Tax=Utexia brackfieldae TaxID=3074108 RepID=UPI00370D9167